MGVLKGFYKFSKEFGLKPNKSKCETAGVEVQKGVSVTCNTLI